MKEVLRYREALWHGQEYLHGRAGFDQEYFVQIYQQLQRTADGLRPPLALTHIKHGGTAPNAGMVAYIKKLLAHRPPRAQGLVVALPVPAQPVGQCWAQAA